MSSQYGGGAPPPPPSSSMPGVAGYPPPPPPPPTTAQHVQQQQQQQGQVEGLDPSSLPRPLSMDDENPAAKAGDGAGGAVEQASGPTPLPGSCDRAYMRMSTSCMPNSSSLRSRWNLPLGIIVHPMSPLGPEVPVVDLGGAGIVRCRRCRTYVNPYVGFTDGGRRWRCNVCAHLNEVPVEYFCTLDERGQRRDVAQRPELCLGSVEYVAPAEYMVRPPMPPVYFFAIDVTGNLGAGVLATVARVAKQCLGEIDSGGGRTQVGVITYDARSVHFYTMKAGSSAPQMSVVTDLEDIFLPQPEDLLVNLDDCRAAMESFFDTLPSAFEAAASAAAASPSGAPPSSLIAAVQAAQIVMGHIGGKLLFFQGGLPSGLRLREHDAAPAYGTDREPTLRQPASQQYKKLAAECSRMQICIDMFVCAKRDERASSATAAGGGVMSADVATVGALPKYTGGQLYYYGGGGPCAPSIDRDMMRCLTRRTGWESVMRIRCGKGVRIGSFHGNFFIRSSDLLAIPAVDEDKTYAVQLMHDETMVTSSTCFFQCALLYTSGNGERRIRVHSLSVPVVSDLGEMYAGADARACAGMLAVQAAEKLSANKINEVRSFVESRLAATLREYRGLYAAHVRGNFGRFVYPSTLANLLPYTLGLLRSGLLRGGADVPMDERSASMASVLSAGLETRLLALYPAVVPLLDEASTKSPADTALAGRRLPPSMTMMREDAAYVIGDGQKIVVWLGRRAPQHVVAEMCADAPTGGMWFDEGTAPQGPCADALRKVRAALKLGNALARVVRQGDTHEQLVLPMLIEDRAPTGPSYEDFVTQIHRATARMM